MNLLVKDGSSQEEHFKSSITKPFISRNGDSLYNPETYINSGLNMFNKRSPYQPSNFIGIKRLRDDNVEDNRGNKPYMNHVNPKDFPILKTPPNPLIYQ